MSASVIGLTWIDILCRSVEVKMKAFIVSLDSVGRFKAVQLISALVYVSNNG